MRKIRSVGDQEEEEEEEGNIYSKEKALLLEEGLYSMEHLVS